MNQQNRELDYLASVLVDHKNGNATEADVQRAYELFHGKHDVKPPYLEGLDPKMIADMKDEWPDHNSTFGLEFMSASSFKAKYEQGQGDWVWDTLLPRGEVIALVGARGEGKTFLGLGAAISASQGLDFGPFKCSGVLKHNVLYITEEALGGVAKRIENYQTRWGITDAQLDESFYMQTKVHQLIETNGGGEPVIKVQDLHMMIRAAQERGDLPPRIDLIVLDYFRRSIIDANENDNGHVAKALSGMYDLAEALNCGVLVVHHKGKNKDGGPRGASVFGDFVYSVLITDGGDLAMKEEASTGDLLFVDMLKETNGLGASGQGGKQPKDGKLDDYRYCLVKQKYNTIYFLSEDEVDTVDLNGGLSKLAQRLDKLLKNRAGHYFIRQDIMALLGCDGGNLTRAFDDLAGLGGYDKGKAGKVVSYAWTGMP